MHVRTRALDLTQQTSPLSICWTLESAPVWHKRTDGPWMLPQKPNPTKQAVAHKDTTWVMWAERVIATLGHTTLPFSKKKKPHKLRWFLLICSCTSFTLPAKRLQLFWKVKSSSLHQLLSRFSFFAAAVCFGCGAKCLANIPHYNLILR